MSLIIAESFDSPALLGKWANPLGSSVTAGGRNGKYWSHGSSGVITYTFLAADEDDVVTVGLALRKGSTSPGTVILLGNATANHVALRTYTNGSLDVVRDPDGTPVVLGTTAAGLLTTGIYYYIELKVKLHDTSGSVELRINGVERLSLSNVDTKQGGAGTTFTNLSLHSQGGRFDDVYCLNEQGSSFNGFLGDIVLEASIPNGAGNSAQMTAFGGAASDQAALTDNSDTTGLEETTDTEKTTLAHSNLTNTTLPVLGVQVWARAKIEVAPAALNLVARSGATETDSAEIAITNAYAWYQNTFATKPGGGAWAASDVDAAEFGIKAQV